MDIKINQENTIDILKKHSIDVNNIVNEDIKSSSEFQCILCLNIVFKPCLIKCCERLFCLACTFAMLEKTKCCPYCKDTSLQFELPGKIITRILNELKFNCYHKDKGCKEVIQYDFLFDHVYNKCEFRNKNYEYKYCNKCTFFFKDDDNSNNIIDSNNKDNKEINSLTEKTKNLSLSVNVPKTNSHICNLLQNVKFNTKQQIKLIKVFKIPFTSPNKTEDVQVHIHSLFYTNIRNHTSNWGCDFCLINSDMPSKISSYNCKECNFDVCEECYDIAKWKKVKPNIHDHKLTVVNYEPDEEVEEINVEAEWVCDVCGKDYGKNSSFNCKDCDFDVCLRCYFDY